MYMQDRGVLPAGLSKYFIRNTEVHSYNTRHRQDFHFHINKKKDRLVYLGAKQWIHLPKTIKNCLSIASFNHNLKSHYLQMYEE